MQKTIRLIWLIWLISLICPSPALASGLKLVVSPPLTELQIKPGEVVQKTIKITNNDLTPVELKASISDFIVQDDQGTPVKVNTQASGRYLASSWLTLDHSTFTLAPQATQEIIVLISAPTNALPGGHYAGVFFSPTVSHKPSTTGAEVIPEVGSLFALTIPGNVNFDAIISSFTTPRFFSEFGPISFAATVENHSDTHISPTPHIVIKDMLGRRLSDLTLATTNIFPFTSRTFTGTWDNIWGFGRYSAELTVPYGESSAATRLLYFWILPYRLLAAALVVILVLVALIILIRRRRRHLADTRDLEIDSLKRRIVELENKR